MYTTLYVFSRYSVAWMIAEYQSAALAEEPMAATCVRQDIHPGGLTIHADWSSSMTSILVVLLIADVGVTKTHRCPHVSNDNSFAESQVTPALAGGAGETLKYRPDYPERFGWEPNAGVWATDFLQRYNHEHHQSALGLLTSADMHFGQAQSIMDQRQQVLQAAYPKNPERFVKAPPAVWINTPRPATLEEPLLSSS